MLEPRRSNWKTGSRALVVGALCLCASACGNWSNADLEFLNALPAKEDLASKLPTRAQTSRGLHQTQSALALGETSELYEQTRNSSQTFNALLDLLLSVIEGVRTLPPTSREDTRRVWGPFPDRKNPGFDVRLVMDKHDDTTFAYRVEVDRPGADEHWVPVWTGQFQASTGVRRGIGKLVLDAEAGLRYGLKNDGLEWLDRLEVDYVTLLPAEPMRVEMLFDLSDNPNSLSRLGYTYRELPDGSGSMQFTATRDELFISEMSITSHWVENGAGRGEARITAGLLAGHTSLECWDDAFRLTHVAQSWVNGTVLGDRASCVSIAGVPDP